MQKMYIFEVRSRRGSDWMSCPFQPEVAVKAAQTVEMMNRMDGELEYRAVPITDEALSAELQNKAFVVSYPEFCVLLTLLGSAIAGGGQIVGMGAPGRPRPKVNFRVDVLRRLYQRLGGEG